MLAALWTCPHCGGEDFLACASDERIGVCEACGYAYARHEQQTDGSTWRQQADLYEDAPEGRGWPKVRADRYRIIRPIASGAQGRILLAHHRHLDQICVIKTFDAEQDWQELAAARLQAEAKAAVLVSHPNVARFLDYDCVDETWYFVMEYVAGENLRNIVRCVRRLCWPQVVEIAAQLADGLAAVHAAGLIHRDVKPSNIMLRADGVPKIMDLGLVKTGGVASDATLTHDGQILGTPYYMPPEQFDGDPQLTPQADTYALGATMYHLLAGKPPFEGGGVIELANKHKHDPVVWPDDVSEMAPSWLLHIVEVCLAKRAEHRFASADAIAEALRRGEDVTTLLPATAETTEPRGVVVTAFRNLSRQQEHDWIGDAVAEYVASRLREIPGLHVVDRHTLAKVLGGSLPAGSETPDYEQLSSKARMLGAGIVIVGAVQCAGDQIRLTAHAVGGQYSDARHVVANVCGTFAGLFDLEDQLATTIAGTLGRQDTQRGAARAGGTINLEANEKFVLSRRAFADGDYAGAIRLAEQALELDPDYVEAVSLIGASHARTGDYDRALAFHEREEIAARRTGDDRLLAEALGNLGVMYYYKGEYALAYEFLEQARNLCAQLSLPSDRAKYEGNLGFVLMRLDRPAEAERAFAEAIDVHKKHGDLVSLAWPYNGMGGVLLKQERYTEASEYYRRALGLAGEIGDRVNVGVGHMNLGRCACLLEDYADAEACFDEALRALEGTSFWNGLTLVYEYMAEMYVKERNLESALTCIDKRIELAQKHDNYRMAADAWEQKAKAYELAGDKEQALDCLKRSIEIGQRPAPHESLHRHLSEIAKRPPFA